VSTLSSDIVIVLVFGAASDYALLLVHRYLEELRHRAATEDLGLWVGGAKFFPLQAPVPMEYL
jgi:hypothetical protein